QGKYFNNVVEQDHRFVKRRVNPGLGFGSFRTARRTIQGYEAMHRIWKGQVEGNHEGTYSRAASSHQSAIWTDGIEGTHPSLVTLPVGFGNTTSLTSTPLVTPSPLGGRQCQSPR